MAERQGTPDAPPRGDASRSEQDARRGDGQEVLPAPAPPESAPATSPAHSVAELWDVNEGLLIAGLREQELAATLEWSCPG